ncbi:Hypothetical protein CINCED_3A003037 [Cinara cedri]|uniref:Uncharacterized protein n=1 Tax=Cinara cedri TaxID=506608 RepID=A0A5E4NCT3_9HEMI|nr:Hypothetical protein CINCED_3A003037 [Cinara cedri]
MTAQWIFIIFCLSVYAGQLLVLGSIFPPIPENQRQDVVTSSQHEVQMPLANLATTPEVIIVDTKLNTRDLPTELLQESKLENGDKVEDIAPAISINSTEQNAAEQKPIPGENVTRNNAKTETNKTTILFNSN